MLESYLNYLSIISQICTQTIGVMVLIIIAFELSTKAIDKVIKVLDIQKQFILFLVKHYKKIDKE